MDTAVVKADLSQLPESFPPVVAPVKGGQGLTLPEEIIAQFRGIDAFAVSIQDQRIVLEPMCNGEFARTPAALPTLEDIQRQATARGLTEQDVAAAVKWARGQR